MSIIEIENLSFAYESQNVLEEVSLTIQPGTITCLLGNNGSGKTTLLDNILGIYPSKRGQIKIHGDEISKISISKRAKYISYIPQNHEEHFPYTVLEIVLMGRNPYLKAYEKSKKEDLARVDEALSLMGIMALKDRLYTQLSGGEMKMVLFARAYVQDTDIILMDEPTASLDLKNEQILLERVAYLVREKHKTIVMSSHEINHPLYFDRRKIETKVAMLKKGRILYQGDVKEIIHEQNIEAIYDVKTKILPYMLEDGNEGRAVITM